MSRCLSRLLRCHTGGGKVVYPVGHRGHHGVTLFFAILCYLTTALLLREKDRFGAIDLRFFYVRRALRIFHLLMPLDGRTTFDFSWPLAAEERFYVVWPLLLKKLASRAHRPAARPA
jgi:peptidoglycan/LPS O-acetylase OafA/YrhL